MPQTANTLPITNLAFSAVVQVFVRLLELRDRELAGHCRRVADLSRRIALGLGLEPHLQQQVFVAGLLHEVGKLGFADAMLSTPVVMLPPAQLVIFHGHPVRAEETLGPLPELKAIAVMVGAQLERFDGAGYPNRLRGAQVPLGSRILSVACDYESLQDGALAQRRLDPSQARDVVQQSAGRRYDPDVVAAFMALFSVNLLPGTERQSSAA